MKNLIITLLGISVLSLGAYAQISQNGSDVYVTNTSHTFGIGTTNPNNAYKLDVNGNTRILGKLYNTGDIYASNPGSNLYLRRNGTATTVGVLFDVYSPSASGYVNQASIKAFGGSTNGATLTFNATTSPNTQVVLWDDGQMNFPNAIRTLGTSGNTAMYAKNKQAIWFNDDYFSWGNGGNWNRFADGVAFGNATEPRSTHAIVVDGGTTENANDIAMVGNKSFIYWYSGDNSDYAGGDSYSGFIGSNQYGSMFFESNLSSANIDGETAVNFLVSDELRMKLDVNGNLGIGTSTPAYRLQVDGNADITGELTAASDKRLKKNIKELDNGLAIVGRLKPSTYQFRVDEYPDLSLAEGQKFGFIAQEMEDVLPELVRTGMDVEGANGSFAVKSVNYIEVIPVLTKAIQEQQEIIDAQKEEIKLLREGLTSLAAKVDQLTASTGTSVADEE